MKQIVITNVGGLYPWSGIYGSHVARGKTIDEVFRLLKRWIDK